MVLVCFTLSGGCSSNEGSSSSYGPLPDDVESIVWSSPTQAMIGPAGGMIEAEGVFVVVPQRALRN